MENCECSKNECGGDVSLVDLNKNIFGVDELRKMARRRFFRDSHSYLYLARHFKLRELYNFYFTKFRVPTGEGFFRGLDGRLIKCPDKVPLPQYVEIETTTVCNKRCYICEYVYWPKDEQVKRHMALDEFKHIVDQFPLLRWANLTGEGSSFLNKDYTKMIKYLWERDRTSIWLVDHLDDIDIGRLEGEVLPYIKGIYLSMDAATKETYEKVKIGCDYDQVIRNLKDIVAYKKRNRTPFPHLCFRYVIIKDNVNEIPLFIDLINSMARPKDWGGSTSIVEFTGLLYFNDIQKYYVPKMPENVIDEVFKRKDGGIEFMFSHADEKYNPSIEKCVAWLEPYIMMPGYVLPCCAVMMSNRRPFLRKYSFGNVFKDDFKNIWNNEYYMKFRSMVNNPDKPVPKICAGCRAYRTKERIKRNGIWDVYSDNCTKHTVVSDYDVTME